MPPAGLHRDIRPVVHASIIALMVLGAAGCVGDRAFHCTTDASCGAQGRCEPVGVCSFSDPSCPSGRRYGEHSSPHANLCVGMQGGGPDGGPDAPPSPTDLDGDGITNAQDNCESVSNATQDNEDGDRFGDACDPCPPVADDAPSDGDGDDVADACDPNPAVVGDQIVVFEGFRQGIPATWESVGTWTTTGDEASASAAAGEHALLSTPAPATGHETVSTSVTVISVVGAINNVAVFDQHAAGTDSEIVCAVYANTAATPPVGLTLAIPNVSPIQSAAYELMIGATYVLRERRDATSYTCNAVRGPATQMVAGTHSLDNAPSSVGIRVAGASARYQWFMVVQSP